MTQSDEDRTLGEDTAFARIPATSLRGIDQLAEFAKSILKKLLPQRLLDLVGVLVTRPLALYYSLKLGGLVLRKGTHDVQVFRDIFVYRSQRIHADLEPRFIVDGGAHIGLASLYFAMRYPNAQIVSIEPESSNYEVLRQNVANHPRIKPVRAAIWHETGEVDIVDAGTGNWGFMAQEKSLAGGQKAPGLTLDRLLGDSGFDGIDILKLDIEGAEREVFAHAPHSWLERVGIILIELHDRKRPGCSEAFFEAVDRYKWRRFKNGENFVLIRSHLLE